MPLSSKSGVCKQEGQALKMLIQTPTYSTSGQESHLHYIYTLRDFVVGENRLRADEDTWMHSRSTGFSKSGCGWVVHLPMWGITPEIKNLFGGRVSKCLTAPDWSSSLEWSSATHQTKARDPWPLMGWSCWSLWGYILTNISFIFLKLVHSLVSFPFLNIETCNVKPLDIVPLEPSPPSNDIIEFEGFFC